MFRPVKFLVEFRVVLVAFRVVLVGPRTGRCVTVSYESRARRHRRHHRRHHNHNDVKQSTRA